MNLLLSRMPLFDSLPTSTLNPVNDPLEMSMRNYFTLVFVLKFYMRNYSDPRNG